MTRRCTTEEFIDKANLVHCNKYAYDLVDYKGNKVKVTITCPIHGNFLQAPSDHLAGKGCMECSGKKRKTTNEFIEAARSVHGDFYDYSKVEYKNGHSKVCIICPEHGEFTQKANDHIHGKKGCLFCGRQTTVESRTMTSTDYLERVTNRYGDLYTYEKLVYEGLDTPVTITCKKHGDFTQIAKAFMRTSGCPECGKESYVLTRRLSNEEFVNRCRDIYGDTLNFDNTIYQGLVNNVEFVCPEHGIVTAKAYSLVHDRSGCGKCTNSDRYAKDKIGYFYINYIVSKCSKDIIKFGVTKDLRLRIRSFNISNHLFVEDTLNLDVVEMDRFSCYELESIIKKNIGSYTGVVDKNTLPDGYTETILVEHLPLLYNQIKIYITGDNNVYAINNGGLR